MRAMPDSDNPDRYLGGLPKDRRHMMEALRGVILGSLPAGYVERFDSGVFAYEIPLTTYPRTYNNRPLLVAALVSQKSFVTLYLMAVYGDKDLKAWFEASYAASGKKLSMGKSCIHFKRPEDVPLPVIGEAIAKVPPERYIEIYEAARGVRTGR